MNFRNKLLIIFLLLMWISASGIIFFDNKISKIVKQQLGEKILSVVKTGALHVDGDKHSKLLTRTDEKTQNYKEIKKILENIRSANPDIRYVYTAKILKTGDMQFVVDAGIDKDENGDGIISQKEKMPHIGYIYGEPKEKYPEFISASKGTPSANTNYATDMRGTWISAAAPIKNEKGETVAVLGADMSVEKVLQITKNIKKGMTIIYLILIFLISIVIAALIAKEITHPIKELVDATKRISGGDYTTEIKVRTQDEIGILAEAFDVMRKKLLDERKQLGRELHDGLAQTLTIACLKTDILLSQVIPEKSKELKDISKTLRASMEDIRRIIHGLKIPGIETKPLREILAEYLEKFQKETGIRMTKKIIIEIDLPLGIKISLIKLFTEAMNNIRKYSDAKFAAVNLTANKTGIVCIIEDDGRSFDIKDADVSSHGGLIGMKEQIKNIGGKMTIVTARGKGTKITVEIPL